MLWKTFSTEAGQVVGGILPKRLGFVHGFVRRSLNSAKSSYFMCKAAGLEHLLICNCPSFHTFAPSDISLTGAFFICESV
jgi:hypothetical protein